MQLPSLFAHTYLISPLSSLIYIKQSVLHWFQSLFSFFHSFTYADPSIRQVSLTSEMTLSGSIPTEVLIQGTLPLNIALDLSPP